MKMSIIPILGLNESAEVLVWKRENNTEFILLVLYQFVRAADSTVTRHCHHQVETQAH